MNQPKNWGIDGDVVVYRVGFASDKNEDSLEDTLAATKAALQSIINSCGEEGTIYLTGKNNFRYAVTAGCFDYKANRYDAGKPTLYDGIRSYVISELQAGVQ